MRDQPYPPRGEGPLSAVTRKRLLRGLLERADAADVVAAESLIRLWWEAQRPPQQAVIVANSQAVR
jgi:hypothetical protein